MKATSIYSPDTRIIPATRHKAIVVEKTEDGALLVTNKKGETFKTPDPDLQAFIVWTMLNPEATA